jgi:hypothetical protein
VTQGGRGETGRNRLRGAGLLASVAGRSRSDWPLVLASWLLLVCATSLITAAATYSESVTVGGFRRALETAAPSETAVRLYTSLREPDLASADAAVEPAMRAALGPGSGRISLIETTDGLSPAGVDASDPAHQILVGSYAGIGDHAILRQGRWPAEATATTGGAGTASQPIEATLSTAAADALGIRVGDLVGLTSKLDPSLGFDLIVVGLWEPDVADRYWLGSGLELTGTQIAGTAVTHGPFVVPPAALAVLASRSNVTAEWRWLPAIDNLRPDQADQLRAAIAGLTDRVKASYGKTRLWMDTGLPDTLSAATRSLLVASASSLVLFAQFALLAIYAILLVAGMLAERRRPETALLRSRGAGWPHIAVLAVGEACLLAVPAVVVAPFAAQMLLGLLGAVGPLAGVHVLAPVGVDAMSVAAAVGAGIGCVAVLTIPALPSLGSLSGVRAAIGRQVGRTLAQRLGLDLILLVVAGLALWQLQTYGAPLTTTVRGDLGIDPLLVASPALGLLAGALVATRLVPRLGEVGERVFERGRALAVPFLARQMGRRPLRYTRVTLLLMLAVALGVFSAAFATTWSRSQADQASYQTGGDVRAVLAAGSGVPSWAFGGLYGGVPGVTGTAQVDRRTFDVGHDVINGQLLGIEPTAAAASSLEMAALGGAPAAGLKAIAADSGGVMVPLPGRPAELAILLDTAITGLGFDGNPDPGMPMRIQVSVVVASSAGLFRVDGGEVPISTNGARAILPLTTSVAGSSLETDYPLRLEAIEVSITSLAGGGAVGTIRVDGAEVRDDSSSDWRPAGPVATAPGWSWSRVEQQEVVPYGSPAGEPGLIDIGPGETQAGPPGYGVNSNVVVFRFEAVPAQGSVPAIANQALLDAVGARVGDTILASRGGYESPVKIVAVSNLFPTLDPAKPFLVVDKAALELADYDNWNVISAADEVWLDVTPGGEAQVAAVLSSGQYPIRTVYSRTRIEEAGRTDPIALGMSGALFLGSLAALALAAIGFLVTVAFMARERVAELAVLRALGESRQELVRMLTIEQLALLGYGLIGGLLLGLALGWVVIPYAWLTPAGTVPVPAPAVSVPWAELAAAALAIGAALCLGAMALIGLATRSSVAGELRSQDLGR